MTGFFVQIISVIGFIVFIFNHGKVLGTGDAIDSEYHVDAYDATGANSYNVATLYDAIVAKCYGDDGDAIAAKVHNGEGTLDFQLLYKDSV